MTENQASRPAGWGAPTFVSGTTAANPRVMTPAMVLAMGEFTQRYCIKPEEEAANGDDISPYYWLHHHYGSGSGFTCEISREEIEHICDVLDPDLKNERWTRRPGNPFLHSDPPCRSLPDPTPKQEPKQEPQPAAWLTTVTIQVLSTDGPVHNTDIRTVLDMADLGEYRVKKETKVLEILDPLEVQAVLNENFDGGADVK